MKKIIIILALCIPISLVGYIYVKNKPSDQNILIQVNSGQQTSILNNTADLIISGTESTKYLSGYTGDTVVITTDNSGANIIQRGDKLLYRNEVYGFQVLLGKEWKGGKIFIITGTGLGDITALIRFSIKHPVTKGGFESHIQLNLYTAKDYMAFKNKPLEPGSTETLRSILKKHTYGKNNIYYIVLTTLVSDNRIQQLYPYIACNNLGKSGAYDVVSCPGRINQLFANGFSTFTIKQ